ncbi:ABC transporter substrate-binding protein [Actibacterium ureilyticum]|uniref:ABC transporter substrate-binding protein n=1 Tax=Actibacterium ureilyticum TaxID=1590614 RepID=UPI000BAADC9C|nr:ABC transporter substrate-binding protein [Actibacterium ureilyticum]
MKKTLVLTTALTGLAFTASAAEVTVMSWGGAYTKSQVEAYHKPFTAETGITVNSVDADNPATPIKAQVEAGNVSVDVADVELSDAIRLCDEGLLEEIDTTLLTAAPDGTPATEDFIDGSLHDCAVANIVWTTLIGYDKDKLGGTEPTSIADFFDLEKYPGKRGMRKAAKTTLEMALMGDGVPAAEVYEVLATDEGVDRAFAKLDSIKDEVIWWEAGAQPPQLLADGEVTMTVVWNGRIFNAIAEEGKPFGLLWDGQIYDLDLFVVPKGAPNKDEAMEFIKFSTATEQLANQASWIPYGPARKSSIEKVGSFHSDPSIDMKVHMPTTEEHLANAVQNDFEFWVDYDAELNERFNAWLAN